MARAAASAGAAAGTGSFQALRLPLRREGAPPSRHAGARSGIFRRASGLHRRDAPSPAHLVPRRRTRRLRGTADGSERSRRRFSSVTRAVLLFAREPSAAGGFGRRLGRLRWKLWLGEASVHTTDEPTLAAAVFAGAQVGVLVGEETALPEPVSEFLELASGRVLPALGVRVEDLAPVHTLRELEQT